MSEIQEIYREGSQTEGDNSFFIENQKEFQEENFKIFKSMLMEKL